MSSPAGQYERTLAIQNQHGLHARPSAEFVKLANKFSADVAVRRDDLEVNGKSIMGIMMLAAECGCEITIRTSGSDAEAALQELTGLVERGFGED
ncbi:MAG: HPr family phosphocarrier protein [Longimicrobiales bacterium]